MFLETYTLYGGLNYGFSQKWYFARNKSIFEVYRMTMSNSFFKFLVQDVEYYKPIEIHQLFY